MTPNDLLPRPHTPSTITFHHHRTPSLFFHPSQKDTSPLRPTTMPHHFSLNLLAYPSPKLTRTNPQLNRRIHLNSTQTFPPMPETQPNLKRVTHLLYSPKRLSLQQIINHLSMDSAKTTRQNLSILPKKTMALQTMALHLFRFMHTCL